MKIFIKRPSSSIFENLIQGIIEKKQINNIIYVLMLSILETYFVGNNITNNFIIARSIKENDMNSILYYISYNTILKCMINAIRYFRRKMMNIEMKILFNKHFKKKFLYTLLINTSPKWIIDTQKSVSEINTAITKGTSAIVSLLIAVIDFTIPLMQSIFGLYLIYQNAFSSILVVIMMGIVFSLGTKVLMKEYVELKKINKITNSLNAQIEFLSGSFMSYLFNREGKQSIDSICDHSNKNLILRSYVKLSTDKKYTTMEIIELSCILLICVFCTYDDIDCATIFALFMNLNILSNNTWRLFYKFVYIGETIAKWATLEDILKDFKYGPKRKNRLMKPYKINGCSETREYLLYAPKAGGKSSSIESELTMLRENYNKGYSYVPQRFNLPNDDTTTIRDFLKLKDRGISDNFCLKYAKLLGISIITRKSLYEKFNKPLGGEIRNITLLHRALPILQSSKLKQNEGYVIFLDETLSGLDEESQKAVQKVIEEIKAKGVTVVRTDHVSFKSKDVIKIHVKDKLDNYWSSNAGKRKEWDFKKKAS